MCARRSSQTTTPRDGGANNFAHRLSEALRGLRITAGLTQVQLAERLGADVASETISRFERGVKVPSLKWLSRIAKALDTNLDVLLASVINEHAPPTPPDVGRLLALYMAMDDDDKERLICLAVVLRNHRRK